MHPKHPAIDELIVEPPRESTRAHLAGCARCRIERRRALLAMQAHPATLPDLDAARRRMAEARQAGTLTLSQHGYASLDPLEDPTPGQSLSGYTVQRLLGRGSAGAVFLVVDDATGAPFALKLLSDQSPRALDRLDREASAQLRLRHPNIVWAQERLEVDGRAAVLLDYVPGPTLAAWIREVAPPPLDVAEAFILGMLRGLRAIHDAGLIHRDLKPGNILLHPDETAVGGFVPRISDFGLVGPHDGLSASGRLTRSGVSLGTPSYMPAEQIRDAHRATAASDVFAAGAVIYEVLCGERAFPGRDLLEVFGRIKDGRFRPLDALRSDTPQAWSALVAACLSPDPSERPAHAGEVLDAWVAAPGPTRLR